MPGALSMHVRTVKQLGAYIRDQRRQRAWTQQQLSEASGTLQSWLSGVEKGKGNPEFGKLLAVLQALDTTLDLQPRDPLPPSSPDDQIESVEEAPTISVRALRARFQKHDGSKT